ncbi:MAG TPA: O-antigen ligase family protein [Vicinamibacterales bacterium]|nr:O-antigen ligase family protein [Vicinamibacterales bacterium]
MSVDRRPPQWMARTGWILAALLAAAPLLSIFYQPVGWGPRLWAVALVLVAAWSPFNGLLVLAGLGPFAATIFALTRTGSAPLNYAEALLLSFLVGAAVRRATNPKPMAVPTRFGAATAVLAALAVASLFIAAVVLRVERPDVTATELLRMIGIRNYLIGSNPFAASMLFIESLALMIMTADACGANPGRSVRVMRMLMVSGAAAALMNVLRIMNSALAQPHPGISFLIQFATVRTNMHFPDLNAAGSYFALMLFIALGLMRSSPVTGAVASLAIASGIWIAGSRTALAAAIGVVAAGLFVRPGIGRRRVLASCALLGGLALVAVLTWKLYPQGRNLDSTGAVSYRITRGKAAISLIAAHPVSGVGPGNFSAMSGVADNAHNNYLQIAAELGLPALALFLLITASALRCAWDLARQSWPAWGLCLGLIAYLLTCLTGHPLLIGGAAYPFWIALGLAASLGSPASSRTALKRLATAAVVIIAATLPLRMFAAAREADVEHSSVGFSKWQQQADGLRYRWAGGRATFYVSPAARSIRIPLRIGPLAPGPIEVTIYLDGVEANRVTLGTEEGEKTVRLNLLRRSKTRFARVDLEARVMGDLRMLDIAPSDSGGVLMVGRPIPES